MLDKAGQGWTRLDKAGQGWTRLDRTGGTHNIQRKTHPGLQTQGDYKGSK